MLSLLGLVEARVGGMDPLCLYLSLDFLQWQLTEAPVYIAPLPPSLPQSARGLFGDAAQEMDASVGLIVQKLHDLGLLDNTMVMFTR